MLFWRRLPPNHLLVVCAGFVWHQLEPATGIQVQVFLRKKAGWSRWLVLNFQLEVVWASSLPESKHEPNLVNLMQILIKPKLANLNILPAWVSNQVRLGTRPGAANLAFISLTDTSHSNTGAAPRPLAPGPRPARCLRLGKARALPVADGGQCRGLS